MIDPNFILLYVAHPATSARFYGDLLAKAPLESSPTFALFALDSGVMLGLWARQTVEPSVAGNVIGMGGELAFAVADNATVDLWHDKWCGRGIPIAQAPTAMDFGYTFVGCDPDGHRLRVFAPASR